MHVVTSAHREFGGLRRLNFFADQAEAWAGPMERASIHILVLGWDHGNLALPFASMGYVVTVLDAEQSTAQAAAAVSAELGYKMECLHGSLGALRDRKFQIIVADMRRDTPRLFSFFGDLAEYREPDGLLLISVSRGGENADWRSFQKSLHQAGWRMRSAEPRGAIPLGLLSFLHRRWGRKDSVLHALDGFDHWLAKAWPLKGASGWLVELEPCDPKRPYVMHLMPALGMGGAEKIVYELVRRLPEHGFDAKAVAIMAGGPLEEAFRAQKLPLDILFRRDRFGFSTLRDLNRLLYLQKPDVVHTHLFGADAWGRLAAFRRRVRIIVSTEHNINPSYGRIKRWVNRLFAKKTDAFVAVSEEVKRVMVKKDGIKAKKIKTIVNGIDLAGVIPRGGHSFHDIPRLITVGRLYPQKNHATLFRALAQIKKPWRLRIVSDGPLEGELRALAERLRIAPRLEWLGVRQDVPKLLAESDLFCFPSAWEGLGLAALEAVAAGVPAIVSDIPPLREALKEEDVTFVPAYDVAAWTRAIEAALDDPVAAVAQAARAMPGVRAKFSADRMVTAYAALYRRLLK